MMRFCGLKRRGDNNTLTNPPPYKIRIVHTSLHEESKQLENIEKLKKERIVQAKNEIKILQKRHEQFNLQRHQNLEKYIMQQKQLEVRLLSENNSFKDRYKLKQKLNQIKLQIKEQTSDQMQREQEIQKQIYDLNREISSLEVPLFL